MLLLAAKAHYVFHVRAVIPAAAENHYYGKFHAGSIIGSGGAESGSSTAEVVEAVVREAYERFKDNRSGKNADYIPYLAQVDSKLFGVAILSGRSRLFGRERIP